MVSMTITNKKSWLILLVLFVILASSSFAFSKDQPLGNGQDIVTLNKIIETIDDKEKREQFLQKLEKDRWNSWKIAKQWDRRSRPPDTKKFFGVTVQKWETQFLSVWNTKRTLIIISQKYLFFCWKKNRSFFFKLLSKPVPNSSRWTRYYRALCASDSNVLFFSETLLYLEFSQQIISEW